MNPIEFRLYLKEHVKKPHPVEILES